MRTLKKSGATPEETWRQVSDRLSPHLGFTVSRKQVRLWREKDYDLHDVATLQHELKNQQAVYKKRPQLEASDDSWPPTLAYTYLPDDAIDQASGTVDVSELLRYLRDEWEAEELHGDSMASLEFRQRTVKSRLLQLRRLIGIDVIAEHRDALCDELFGKEEN